MCRKDILRSADKVLTNNSHALKLGILQQKTDAVLPYYHALYFVILFIFMVVMINGSNVLTSLF